ncbi:hypothetical protein ACET3Z_004111 [Daucus carota]
MTKPEMELVEQGPDFIALFLQFKASAMDLISVLEQKQTTGGRTKTLKATELVNWHLQSICVAEEIMERKDIWP